jgi:hypothetical protein
MGRLEKKFPIVNSIGQIILPNLPNYPKNIKFYVQITCAPHGDTDPSNTSPRAKHAPTSCAM